MYNLLKQTTLYYILFIAITALVGVFSAIYKPFHIEGELAISLESLMIIINLSAMPIVMKYFSGKLKTLNNTIDNEEEKILAYKNLCFQRIASLSIIIIINFILFSLLNKSSCFMCSGLIYILSFFFLPTKNRIETELVKEDNI